MSYVGQMEFDAPPVHSPPPPPVAPHAVVPQPPGAVLRARTVLVSAAASLATLVVIVATNNQSVTDWVVRKATGHPNSFAANVGLASQAFRWRLSKNTTDSLPANYTRDLVLVVLTGLLVAAVVRGAVTFGRAFWGTWMAVIVAAQLGAVASAFVVPAEKLPAGHSATQRFFLPNAYTPGPYIFLGAAGLGLVVAAITALVAVTTRKTAAPAWVNIPPSLAGGWPEPIAVPPPPAMPEPPPWTPAPSYAEAPAWTAESAESAETAAMPTTALPRWGEDETQIVHWSEETNTLPRWEAPPPPGEADEQTTTLPRIEPAEAETTTLPPIGEAPHDSRVRIDEQDEDGDDEDDYPPSTQRDR